MTYENVVNNDSNSMDFDTLTDDCILHIFRHLEANDLFRARKVCERWRVLATCKSLWPIWKKLEVCFNGRGTDAQFTRSFEFLKVAPVLGAVELRELNARQSDMVSYVIAKYGHPAIIRKLSVYDVKIEEDDLKSILACLSFGVEELALEGVELKEKDNFNCDESESDSYESDADDQFYIPTLKSLSVDTNVLKFFYQDALWPALQHFSLFYPEEETLSDLLKKCAMLRNLKDQLRKITVYHGDIFLHEFPKFIEHFPKLDSLCFKLSFKDMSMPDMAHWEFFPANGPTVELWSTSFSGYACNLAGALGEPLAKAQNVTICLEYAEFEEITEDISTILSDFQEMKKLTLYIVCSKKEHNCDSYGVDDVECIIDLVKAVIPEKPSLKILCLKGCAGSLFVSDDTAKELAEKFPSLKVVFEFVEKSSLPDTFYLR